MTALQPASDRGSRLEVLLEGHLAESLARGAVSRSAIGILEVSLAPEQDRLGLRVGRAWPEVHRLRDLGVVPFPEFADEIDALEARWLEEGRPVPALLAEIRRRQALFHGELAAAVRSLGTGLLAGGPCCVLLCDHRDGLLDPHRQRVVGFSQPPGPGSPHPSIVVDPQGTPAEFACAEYRASRAVIVERFWATASTGCWRDSEDAPCSMIGWPEPGDTSVTIIGGRFVAWTTREEELARESAEPLASGRVDGWPPRSAPDGRSTAGPQGPGALAPPSAWVRADPESGAPAPRIPVALAGARTLPPELWTTVAEILIPPLLQQLRELRFCDPGFAVGTLAVRLENGAVRIDIGRAGGLPGCLGTHVRSVDALIAHVVPEWQLLLQACRARPVCARLLDALWDRLRRRGIAALAADRLRLVWRTRRSEPPGRFVHRILRGDPAARAPLRNLAREPRFALQPGGEPLDPPTPPPVRRLEPYFRRLAALAARLRAATPAPETPPDPGQRVLPLIEAALAAGRRLDLEAARAGLEPCRSAGRNPAVEISSALTRADESALDRFLDAIHFDDPEGLAECLDRGVRLGSWLPQHVLYLALRAGAARCIRPLLERGYGFDPRFNRDKPYKPYWGVVEDEAPGQRGAFVSSFTVIFIGRDLPTLRTMVLSGTFERVIEDAYRPWRDRLLYHLLTAGLRDDDWVVADGFWRHGRIPEPGQMPAPLELPERDDLFGLLLERIPGLSVHRPHPEQGVTLLMAAAALGLGRLVRRMLREGPLLGLRDRTGRTALDYARLYRREDLVPLLDAPSAPEDP